MSANSSGECLNCQAALAGPYCATCGQKAVKPHPTFHDLVHEFTHELLHEPAKFDPRGGATYGPWTSAADVPARPITSTCSATLLSTKPWSICPSSHKAALTTSSAAGREDRDTDIGQEVNEKFREVGFTLNLQRSVRLNAREILADKMDTIKDHYPYTDGTY